ncbi:MAG: hypothetical protein HQK51_19215 [Oligoflexia bacterium]|nr:hypothetical protein [Oligoflexia bacterium]
MKAVSAEARGPQGRNAVNNIAMSALSDRKSRSRRRADEQIHSAEKKFLKNITSIIEYV